MKPKFALCPIKEAMQITLTTKNLVCVTFTQVSHLSVTLLNNTMTAHAKVSIYLKAECELH